MDNKTRALIDELPFPVARPAAVAFDESVEVPAQLKVWDLMFTAYQALRMVSLPVVSQYLDHPISTQDMGDQRAVGSIGRALARIRCPHFGDWVTLLETLARHVTEPKVGFDPDLPLADIVRTIRSRSFEALHDPANPVRYRAIGQEPGPAHRSLGGLRNALAHGGSLPDDDTCAKLLAHYRPVLGWLLDACSPLADCELVVREGEFLDADTSVRRLVGPELREHEAIGQAEEWLSVLENSDVALRTPRGHIQALGPLFAVHPGSPIGLYDGHNVIETLGAGRKAKVERQRHVFYLGAGHDSWTDPEPMDDLVGKLRNRAVRWRLDKQHLTPVAIADAVRYTTRVAIDDLRGLKYFPDCYVERKELTTLWRAFLDEERTPAQQRPLYPNGLVLSGQGGSGKTAWTCRITEVLLSEGLLGTRQAESARFARNLVVLLRGDLVPQRTKKRLLPAVLERLGLRGGDFQSFEQLFEALDRSWAEDPVHGRRFVLILDAVNEAIEPERVMFEALECIRAASRHPWCRCVVTVRSEFLAVWRAKREGNERNPLGQASPCLFQGNADSASEPSADVVVPLALLSADDDRGNEGEAAQVYRRIRAQGLLGRPGCTSEWVDLDASTRELLRRPLMQILLHRTWPGQPARHLGGSADLLRAYVDEISREFDGVPRASHAVVEHVLRTGRTVLHDEDVRALREPWSRGKSPAEARLSFSPVETLAIAGLLCERTIDGGAAHLFVYDTVLEYLIARGWMAQEPDLPVQWIKALIEEGRGSSRPNGYWNALSYIFERLALDDRGDDWAEVVVTTDHPAARDAAARAWVKLALSSGTRSDTSVSEVAELPAGRVVQALGRRSDKWALFRLTDLGHALPPPVPGEWLLLLGRTEESMRCKGAPSKDTHGMEAVARSISRIRIARAHSQRREFDLARETVLETIASLKPLRDEGSEVIEFLLGESVVEVPKRDVAAFTSGELELELAKIESADGRHDKAAEAAARSRDTLARYGRREGPQKLPGLRRLHAEATAEYGRALLEQGDTDGASEAIEEAIGSQLWLLQNTRNPDLVPALITNMAAHAKVHEARGELDRAIALIQSLREGIAQGVMDDGSTRTEQYDAQIAAQLGLLTARAGDVELAATHWEDSRKQLERLIEGEGRTDMLFDLGQVSLALARCRWERGNLAEGLDEIERARGHINRMKGDSRQPRMRGMLAEHLLDVAHVLVDRGHLDEAAALVSEVRGLFDQRSLDQDGWHAIARRAGILEAKLDMVRAGRAAAPDRDAREELQQAPDHRDTRSPPRVFPGAMLVMAWFVLVCVTNTLWQLDNAYTLGSLLARVTPEGWVNLSNYLTIESLVSAVCEWARLLALMAAAPTVVAAWWFTEEIPPLTRRYPLYKTLRLAVRWIGTVWLCLVAGGAASTALLPSSGISVWFDVPAWVLLLPVLLLGFSYVSRIYLATGDRLLRWLTWGPVVLILLPIPIIGLAVLLGKEQLLGDALELLMPDRQQLLISVLAGVWTTVFAVAALLYPLREAVARLSVDDV